MARKQINPLTKLYGMNGIKDVTAALANETGYRKELIENFLMLDARALVRDKQDKIAIEELVASTAKVDEYNEDYSRAFMDLIKAAQEEGKHT